MERATLKPILLVTLQSKRKAFSFRDHFSQAKTIKIKKKHTLLIQERERKDELSGHRNLYRKEKHYNKFKAMNKGDFLRSRAKRSIE